LCAEWEIGGKSVGIHAEMQAFNFRKMKLEKKDVFLQLFVLFRVGTSLWSGHCKM
jgi:hypothetical protein